MGLGKNLAHALWNTFVSDDSVSANPLGYYTAGPSSSVRPDRYRGRVTNERTIISSIYTRLSVDCAAMRIEHIRLKDGIYTETIDSGLNECLTVAANIDQPGRFFRQDVASTLFQEGCIAIVPVDLNVDPRGSGGWDIRSLRVGIIQHWWPEEIQVRVYNEKKGVHEDIKLPKSMVAIVENPFYSVMNEPNSTLQRLVRKLSLLDNVDEISSSGKLDIIIQLPYQVRSETRKNQAKRRTDEIKEQLRDSTYGIAYTDGTEKITQLNRSVENNLLEQVKYLKGELYNELGLTEEIMNGTADDVTMLNYINRTIEPVMDAIVEAMIPKFLTKTARSQGQTIQYFQTPFKLLPVSKLAEVTDVLSRNQIITPNEVRPALGLKPSKEPQANQLINSNMPLDKQVTSGNEEASPPELTQADKEEAALDANMAELGLS